MTKNQKRIAIAGGAAVIAAVTVSVFAYFAARDEKPNLVGVGEDDISISETFTPPDQTKPYRKVVRISNTGSVPCYVRAKIEFSDSQSESRAYFSAENADSETPPADVTYYKASPAAAESYTAHLPAGWTYNAADGYYYYESAVAPGKDTSALLAWVKMEYENGAQVTPHDIFVYSESVQTIDPKTGAAYAGYTDAWTKFTAAAP